MFRKRKEIPHNNNLHSFLVLRDFSKSNEFSGAHLTLQWPTQRFSARGKVQAVLWWISTELVRLNPCALMGTKREWGVRTQSGNTALQQSLGEWSWCNSPDMTSTHTHTHTLQPNTCIYQHSVAHTVSTHLPWNYY